MRELPAIIRDLGSKQREFDDAHEELPRCEERCRHLLERIAALAVEIDQLYAEMAEWHAKKGES